MMAIVLGHFVRSFAPFGVGPSDCTYSFIIYPA